MPVKLKVHGTLPRTGLLAESGGFAGVEESARQLAAGNLGKSWRASYSLGCHHLLQTLVSLVQRKVPRRVLHHLSLGHFPSPIAAWWG
jgi:hypothetical protein